MGLPERIDGIVARLSGSPHIGDVLHQQSALGGPVAAGDERRRGSGKVVSSFEVDMILDAYANPHRMPGHAQVFASTRTGRITLVDRRNKRIVATAAT